LPITDYLRPGLDLLFVGINPGLRSESAGHHYAGPGNHFWPLLFESGIVPEPLTFADDARVLEYNIGLTNLVQRSSRSMDDLTPTEMRKGAERLRKKLRTYRPKIVCFNGKRIYEVFVGRRCDFGLQPEKYAGAELYVMPSTSARTQTFPRATDKLPFFRELKKLLDSARAE
jgi:thymine-DNA glycosylase